MIGKVGVRKAKHQWWPFPTKCLEHGLVTNSMFCQIQTLATVEHVIALAGVARLSTEKVVTD